MQSGPRERPVMRIFVYEFVTGGGWYSWGEGVPPESLVREGMAMASAIGADLAALGHTDVVLLRDHRFDHPPSGTVRTVSVTSRFEELAAFKQLATDSDWTIVIAPEFSGFLAQRIAIVEKLSGRLLGPGLATIRLTSDKHLTAEYLAQRNIPVPRGLPLEPHASLPIAFTYPAVLKPRGGAGSLGVRLVRSETDVGAINEPSRLEVFCEGEPASVAFLCGPAGNRPLIPCRQRLSEDGRFTYLGGSLPLSPPCAARATGLARQALAALGPVRGYLGVDLVLGSALDGSADVVIEINSRLTTSYVGLRAVARSNLAEAMLRIAEGCDAGIVFDDREVQFDASGRVW